MIEFDNLSFWYKDNDSPSLSDINISIDEGEFVLVTGPSGCGKSTFIRSINGLIPHFYGGKIKGDVTVSGKKVSETPTNILSEKVGMVFQDPENQLITNEVEREIAFALENLCFSPDLIAKRIEEAIEAVGISRIRHENPSNLSGGQKQTVAIASALAVHPEILLLDDPPSELDPAAAESILNIIEKINDELGITVILIEHRLERVVHHVDRMLILQDSKIIFDDNPRKINYNERKNWRIGLPPVTELSLRFADKLNNHELPLTVKEARTTLKELLSSMNNIIDLPEEKSLGREILSMKNVYFSYDGANDILKNINLSLREGDQLSIMGKNASGKTTLIKLINGILKQRKGSISLYGKKIEDYSSSEIIKRVGIVFQDPNLHLFNETVEEEIGFVLKNLGQDADTIETKVTQIMDEFGISQYKYSYPLDLSGGEKQRVAIASVLVGDPDILILDEPTRGLDYPIKMKLINYLRKRNKTVIMVTHDVETAAQFSNRVILLSEGKVVTDGYRREVLSKALLFSPQINRLIQPYAKNGIPDNILTLDEILEVLT